MGDRSLVIFVDEPAGVLGCLIVVDADDFEDVSPALAFFDDAIALSEGVVLEARYGGLFALEDFASAQGEQMRHWDCGDGGDEGVSCL